MPPGGFLYTPHKKHVFYSKKNNNKEEEEKNTLEKISVTSHFKQQHQASSPNCHMGVLPKKKRWRERQLSGRTYCR